MDIQEAAFRNLSLGTAVRFRVDHLVFTDKVADRMIVPAGHEGTIIGIRDHLHVGIELEGVGLETAFYFNEAHLHLELVRSAAIVLPFTATPTVGARK